VSDTSASYLLGYVGPFEQQAEVEEDHEFIVVADCDAELEEPDDVELGELDDAERAELDSEPVALDDDAMLVEGDAILLCDTAEEVARSFVGSLPALSGLNAYLKVAGMDTTFDQRSSESYRRLTVVARCEHGRSKYRCKECGTGA
jgi:hypothetical protein